MGEGRKGEFCKEEMSLVKKKARVATNDVMWRKESGEIENLVTIGLKS